MKISSLTLSAVIALSVAWSGPAAAYCLDGLDVGMFTERDFTELDAPPRREAQDKRLNAMLKRGMRTTGANLVSIDSPSKKEAVEVAAKLGHAALAFLELEAVSSPDALGGDFIVNVSSATTLQILSVGDGDVLGEGSDIQDVQGTDIEDALEDILTAKTIETLAEKAEKSACAKGLSGSSAVAAKDPVPTAPAASAADPLLVTEIQHGLINAGFDPGLPDGQMGAKTKAAIKQAEMKLKMPATGQPSPLLAHKLGYLDKTLINQVQRALHDLGRVEGRPTGVLDGETQREIEAAEFEFGLSPADGLPDHDLLRVLRARAPEADQANGRAVAPSAETVAAADDPGLRLRIEELLIQLDYFTGPASGIDTIDSQDAIWRAERDLGLQADGVPDKQLWRALTAKASG